MSRTPIAELCSAASGADSRGLRRIDLSAGPCSKCRGVLASQAILLFGGLAAWDEGTREAGRLGEMGQNQKLIMRLRRELNRETKQIKHDYFILKPDNPFVLWFAEAKITGNRAEARDGIIGEPGDMGVDAVYLDEGL